MLVVKIFGTPPRRHLRFTMVYQPLKRPVSILVRNVKHPRFPPLIKIKLQGTSSAMTSQLHGTVLAPREGTLGAGAPIEPTFPAFHTDQPSKRQ